MFLLQWLLNIYKTVGGGGTKLCNLFTTNEWTGEFDYEIITNDK